jgi:predicted Zn-dependent protease
MLVDSPRSYRSHWVRALRLFDARDTEGGDREFAAALALFPADPELLVQIGDRYLASQRCAEAIRLYRRSMELESGERYLGTRLVSCLVQLGRLEEARQELARELLTGEADARRDSVRFDSILRVLP